MQDIQHSIESTAGEGRLFAGAGNRQLRPPHHHHHHHHHHDLKCPRCDSSNTKFCYYNNYNLSQPRHFCKSCRRYWTNGGVLRNVPVGGGVRKAKRSGKPKSKPTVSNSSSSAVASEPLDPSDLGHRSTNSENSSSDSCSRTATATATGNTAPITTAAEVLNFNESSTRFFDVPQSDPVILSQSSGLMRSWTDDQLPNLGSIQKAGNVEMERDVKMAGNWEESVDDDEGIFDQSYWSESQWSDDHNHLLNYLP